MITFHIKLRLTRIVFCINITYLLVLFSSGFGLVRKGTCCFEGDGSDDVMMLNVENVLNADVQVEMFTLT